ncbi:MAG: type protein arginine methyltransferase [Micromonosporaceae bacterium]|nr:type protein arginine methyltransferase [Micromonosporaceae bacterium]
MEATQKVFTSYDIQACLYDEDRVRYFQEAIFRTVRPGDIVVDAGSGTGILGLFAAQAGAAKVYCLEINEDYVKVIQENAKRNMMQDVIIATHADATTCDLPRGVDVITVDVISAGFFYEPQLQILNNLTRFLRDGGSTVPIAMRNYVELIHAQEELYGLTFSYDTRYRALARDTALTNRVEYLGTTFGRQTSPSVEATVRLRSHSPKTANAVRISYSIQFAPDLWISTPTEFLMNPQIIFLQEPIQLADGDEYNVYLAYEASSSPVDCKLDITHAAPTPRGRPPRPVGTPSRRSRA